MQRHITIVFLALTCFLLFAPSTTVAKAIIIEIDFKGTTKDVIDGDTFDIVAENGTQYRIRLADVDAPERDESGYAEAKEYLKNLVYGEVVYLDSDDLYIWDDYGRGNRVVCVTYVEHNSTHYLNTNEALFRAGHVEKREYTNEFTPYNWELYIPKQESTEFPLATGLVGIGIVAIAVLVVYLNRSRKYRGN